MFNNTNLERYLKTSSAIESKTKVIASWNLNLPDNIEKVGNYRYRKFDTLLPKYQTINQTYDPYDADLSYTGATYADVSLDGVNITDQEIEIFSTQKDYETMLFSLEDCVGRFRPRSGINKIRYGVTKFLHHSNAEMASRPRYYLADRNDTFKYWTSYRTESLVEEYSLLPTFAGSVNTLTLSQNQKIQFIAENPSSILKKTLPLQAWTPSSSTKIIKSKIIGSSEYGIANKTVNGINYIDDTAPFVVYKEPVPVNRIVIKMQTNVGSVDLGKVFSPSGETLDPLFEDSYRTVPSIWKIQYLSDGSWVDAISFDQFSQRADGSKIVGSDGYVELGYGPQVPDELVSIFRHKDILLSTSQLPKTAKDGDAYLVKPTSSEYGTYYIYRGGTFINDYSFVPQYGWNLIDDSTSENYLVTKLSSPYYHESATTGQRQYDEFEYVSGLRIVVEAMENPDTSFDLIEMSPRLVSNISEMVSSLSVTKNMSDLGVSGLPVGQLLASVGDLSLFDYDIAFSEQNSNSIIKNISSKNLQVKIMETVITSDNSYDIPIKTLYVDGNIQTSVKQNSVTIPLRDLFFYFESTLAPQIFATDVSLSYAVSMLLDSIGFSNYVFKRIDGENDPIIPYFYIKPESKISDVLSSLAISTQSAMYFDEYNNFVVATKNYSLPVSGQRDVDYVISADKYIDENGDMVLPEIMQISSVEKNIFTGGKIQYQSKYIQKSEASTKQTYMLDKDKTWVYKPSLLWEVSGNPTTKARNEQSSTQEAFTLSAIPLNSDIPISVPYVKNRVIVNNYIDLADGVYWLGTYNGYFYANGEIIKFDAVEYSVSGISGNVWIGSVQEYQYYFSKITFNGKMYPTGRVRIFAEPYYENILGQAVPKNGKVAKHGRGQFGTNIVKHSAGIDEYWTSNSNIRGMSMQSQYLFGSEVIENNLDISNPDSAVAGKYIVGTDKLADNTAKQSKRSGLMKNYMSTFFDSETGSSSTLSTDADMIQSSAFIFEGPELAGTDSPASFISYVPKVMTNNDPGDRLVSLDNSQYTQSIAYRHFGTRMRIIGKVQNNSDLYQSASGATTYYDTESSSPDSESLVTGGGGGISILLNPDTNTGYFFEIAALDKGTSSVDSYTLDDVFFYKVQASSETDTDGNVITNAVPIKLWSGSAGILVDSGTMSGQSTVYAQENQTVYDISVEYKDVGSAKEFYLYINGTQIATVIDENPLKTYGYTSLFVRGSSKCMFENIYALKNSYATNPSTVLETLSKQSFGSTDVNLSESFRKHAISGLIQDTYLSGISPSSEPKNEIYYDEFGTIMREAAYFNIRYDKAFPALYSKIVPRTNEVMGYTVSGYRGKAYGAEFLIFNSTDTTIRLDESSGNYLKIQGIAFTQNTSNELTVDDYFNLTADLSPTSMSMGVSIESPVRQLEKFNDIRAARRLYGNNEFAIEAEYLQSHDDAFELMGWLSETVMKPRLSVGVSMFANPLIQLGDIVTIRYTKNDIDYVIDNSKKFVVYNISYKYSGSGPEMDVFLSEVG